MMKCWQLFNITWTTLATNSDEYMINTRMGFGTVPTRPSWTDKVHFTSTRGPLQQYSPQSFGRMRYTCNLGRGGRVESNLQPICFLLDWEIVRKWEEIKWAVSSFPASQRSHFGLGSAHVTYLLKPNLKQCWSDTRYCANIQMEIKTCTEVCVFILPLTDLCYNHPSCTVVSHRWQSSPSSALWVSAYSNSATTDQWNT